MVPLFIAIVVLNLHSGIYSLDPTKTGNQVSGQHHYQSSTHSLTSPTTSSLTPVSETGNFRDSLRLKLKLVNNAMKYGGSRTSGLISSTDLDSPRTSGLISPTTLDSPRTSELISSTDLDSPRTSELISSTGLNSPRTSGLFSPNHVTNFRSSNHRSGFNSASTYGGITTESTSLNLNDESLGFNSAELGASNEVTVNDQTGPEHLRLALPGTKLNDVTDNRLVKAAVQTKHTFEYRPIKIDQLQEFPEPRIIEVEAQSLPLEIHFKSASSRIKMVQQHQKGDLQQEERISTEEEPQRLLHLVRKPIIQEVREIITPYRRVIQEIQPVVEEIRTVISHNGKKRYEDEQRLITTENKPTAGLEMEEHLNNNNQLERQLLKPMADANRLPQHVAHFHRTSMANNIENFVRAQQQNQKVYYRQQLHQNNQNPNSIYQTANYEKKFNTVPSEMQSRLNDDLDDSAIMPARIQQQIQRRNSDLNQLRDYYQQSASNQNAHFFARPQSLNNNQWNPLQNNWYRNNRYYYYQQLNANQFTNANNNNNNNNNQPNFYHQNNFPNNRY